jgi:long-chain acyl-CoA synthetase
MNSFREMLIKNAEYYPDKTAFIFKDKRYTFKQVNNRVNSIINALSVMGLKKGDHIGILAYNCPQYFEAFALSKAGFVCVPLNFRSVARELIYLINNSEIKTLIIAKEFIDLVNSLKSQIGGVKNFIALDFEADGMKNYEELILRTHGPVEPGDNINPEDDAAIYYTSGTTGRSKGAVHTHKSLLAEINLPNRDLSPEDNALCVMPFFHVGGTAAYQFGVYAAGATSVVLEKFNETDVLKIIESERITYVCMVPAMIIRLLDYPDLKEFDISSLKTIHFTGAPMPVDVLRRGTAVFGSLFHQELGQTETLNLSRFKKNEYKINGTPKDIKRLESAGKPAIEGEIKIVDEKGNEVPLGQVGEIVSCSDRIMRGYWKMPKETDETIRDGWLHTGDLGRMDEDGYLFIVDRKKDMIISGGENIYSQEVEDALYSHPAVLYAAVIGVPDEKMGESVKAVLVLKSGATATEKEIIDYCKENLAGYKKPKTVEFFDSLPMTGSGKIQKNLIREKYWKEYDKKVN